MKHFLLGSVTAIAIFAVAVLGYVALGFANVAADTPPSSWESRLLSTTVHASVRRRAGVERNPLPDSNATLIAGGKLYMNDCVGCHGAPGQPPSHFGATFHPRVPQFSQNGSRYSQAELFWVAKHGIRMSGMYPQAPHYSNSDLWKLAAFIGRFRDLPPAVVEAIQQSGSN